MLATPTLSSIEQQIVSWRCDSLNLFFGLFPYLSGHYFYIVIIALGYWSRPRSQLFPMLALLIPYATLLNGLIKNIFRIPRPEQVEHLISVYDPFGFPSGDMQVSTVFWSMIFLKSSGSSWRWFCILPVIGIGLSRVYLGVHRLNEVLAGFAVGLAILFLWEKVISRLIWQHTVIPHMLLSCGIVAAYLSFSVGLTLPPMFSLSVGTLLGLAVNWRLLVSENRPALPFIGAIAALIVVIALVRTLPLYPDQPLYWHMSITAKFFLVVLAVFGAVPRFYQLIQGIKNHGKIE